MMMNMNPGMMEDVAIIGGLIGMQIIYAGNCVLLSYLMNLGLNSLTIVVYTSFSTFLVLLPFAFFFERFKWPNKFSFKLLMRVLVLSVGGVTFFQTLMLKGINLTSPTMGTAMPNIAPGLIFFIAWIFRLEKVKLSCTYSRVKILGTLLCVIGALTLSIMQSFSTPKPIEEGTIQLSPLPPPNYMFDRNKIIGCLYLLIAVVLLSCNIVLQAFTLGDFPAPMSLCAITSFFGGFMTITVELIEYKEFQTGWPILSFGNMIGYSLLAGAVGGICLSFNNWAIEKRGPVLVSMFSPIGTVCSVIFSIVTLRSSINIGSFAGMLLMFIGLYFVLWAKGKESYANQGGPETKCDAEKPLLS